MFFVPQSFAAIPVGFCATVTDVPTQECDALVDVYNDTNGDNWTNKTGWGVSTSVCTWN